MANWKKVIVSGSNAELNDLKLSGNAQITGSLSAILGNATLPNIVSYNPTTGLFSYQTTGSLLATTASLALRTTGSLSQVASRGIAPFSFDGSTNVQIGSTSLRFTGTETQLTGSFTGSFAGEFVGVTNLPDLTQGVGITAFTYDGGATATVAVSGASTLSTNKVTKWTGNAFADSTLTDNGTTATFSNNVTVNNDLVVNNNLTVFGTASFQQTTNLEVADRFILLASGSNAAGDGGLVIQQATQNVGELFGFDNGTTRWAVTSSFSANQSAFTPDAFMAAVVEGASGDPTSAPARYVAKGNIFVGNDETIWIYS